MKTEDKIVQYLIDTYNPYSIIIYGSFSNGTNNENIDFDALIITDNINKHDTNIIDGTVLDVFIYPAELLKSIMIRRILYKFIMGELFLIISKSDGN